MPFPPIIYLASLAIWIAFMQLFLFIMDIIQTASQSFPFNLETCKAANVAKEISVCISASFFWINWNDARGTPNCFLSNTYQRALWKQNQAAPNTPHEIPNLALFRQEKGPFKPFTVGKMFYLGTLTLSKTMSPVIEAFRESLPLILLACSPFIPFQRMKPRISPFQSFAHTTNTSAMGELVIHILEPFRTYSFPQSMALVFMDPGSEPQSGSVSPKQPINYPEQRPGRYFYFCYLDPNQFMGWITKEFCTLKADLQALSTLSIYLFINPYEVQDNPAIPKSVKVHPKKPFSPICLMMLLSNIYFLLSYKTLGIRTF